VLTSASYSPGGSGLAIGEGGYLAVPSTSMLHIQTIHHVSLPVSDLERAKAFYRDVLELQEIPRPPFDFPGAWYQLGDRQLHLTVGERSTFRSGKGTDARDIHFAIRVASYRGALEHLESKGFRNDAVDDLRRLRVNPMGRAGLPQIHLLDPDRNLIEITAERLD
jgi:glyoxylase I family protein